MSRCKTSRMIWIAKQLIANFEWIMYTDVLWENKKSKLPWVLVCFTDTIGTDLELSAILYNGSVFWFIFLANSWIIKHDSCMIVTFVWLLLRQIVNQNDSLFMRFWIKYCETIECCHPTISPIGTIVTKHNTSNTISTFFGWATNTVQAIRHIKTKNSWKCCGIYPKACLTSNRDFLQNISIRVVIEFKTKAIKCEFKLPFIFSITWFPQNYFHFICRKTVHTCDIRKMANIYLEAYPSKIVSYSNFWIFFRTLRMVRLVVKLFRRSLSLGHFS